MLPVTAAAPPQHAGRPLSTDAVLRQRAPRVPGSPVGRQRAVRVLGAVQPAGSLSHHHVRHRHAEVSAAARELLGAPADPSVFVPEDPAVLKTLLCAGAL